MFCSINGWIMRRLRAILWKQWKNPRTRVRELKKGGIYNRQAVTTGNSRKGPWRMSKVKWVIIALQNRYFRHSLKLYLPGSPAQISRTAMVRDPYVGWCGLSITHKSQNLKASDHPSAISISRFHPRHSTRVPGGPSIFLAK